MDNTELLAWLVEKEARITVELANMKENVKILESQKRVYKDMIARCQQKNNSPVSYFGE